MRKVSFLIVMLLAFVAMTANAGTGIVKNQAFYMLEAASTDTGANKTAATAAGVLDSIGTARGLWYDLGPVPSNPGDSGVLIIVTNGAPTKVACSLFVSTSPSPSKQFNRDWLHFVAAGTTIIADSCQVKKANIYPFPNLTQNLGFKLIAKLFQYSGATGGYIEAISVRRRAQ